MRQPKQSRSMDVARTHTLEDATRNMFKAKVPGGVCPGVHIQSTLHVLELEKPYTGQMCSRSQFLGIKLLPAMTAGEEQLIPTPRLGLVRPGSDR